MDNKIGLLKTLMAKALLKDSATAMKELKEESKELNQLAHKASSKAGSRRYELDKSNPTTKQVIFRPFS